MVTLFTDKAGPGRLGCRYLGDVDTEIEVAKPCRLKAVNHKQAMTNELLPGPNRLTVKSTSAPMEQNAS